MASSSRSSILALALPLSLVALGCGGVETTTTGTSTSTGSGEGGSGSTTSTTSTATGSGGSGGSGSTTSSTGTGMTVCGPDVDAVPNLDLGVTKDPEAGNFTMDEALVQLPMGPGPLRAIIETDLGTVTCVLHDVEAPIGVANFVGLARGRRAFRDPVTKKWVLRRFYDGLTFHRVIPGFMAQGGDPLGTGTGGPGYKFVNEIAGLHHDPGTLAYANAGADTNGSQFYITETEQSQLDAGYTNFGACTPLTVVPKLTAVPRDANDKPLKPLHMKTITITRCAP
jgi:peptidyl-prolyl cis-trans isomerase A (cyclophilin A)